jgi:predicted GIY-YIG superfamily endonuclease
MKSYLITHLEKTCGKDPYILNSAMKKLKDKNSELETKISELETKIKDLEKEKSDMSLRIIDNINPMNKVIKPDFNKTLVLNNIIIIARPEDGYINATELCKAGNKEFKHYKENKNTQVYLQVLSSVVGIPTTDLIHINKGGSYQCTWVHRKVAINLAQWISAEFSVRVSSWIDELMITGKVILGNERSNYELENVYQDKINKLNKELENKNNKLKNYETTVFNRNVDYCPIEYYGKDIVYFLKFDIPLDFYSKYLCLYPNIKDEDYSCIEFGVSSDIEKRLLSHKRDKKKENIIFLHAIELDKRYLASKMEFYIKTLAKQLNINLDYEKKKECFIANEDEFNIIINKVNSGLSNIEEIDSCDEEEGSLEIEDERKVNKIDKEVEIHRIDADVEIHRIDVDLDKIDKKIQSITELFKNKIISVDDYKEMLSSF